MGNPQNPGYKSYFGASLILETVFTGHNVEKYKHLNISWENIAHNFPPSAGFYPGQRDGVVKLLCRNNIVHDNSLLQILLTKWII